MDSIEVTPLETSVRRSYEVARMKRALWGFAPALILPAFVFCLEGAAWSTGLLAVGLFAVGVLSLWRGQDRARGVLPGLAVGVVPLAAALCASRMHMHMCAGGACMSACVPACTAGGLAAGIAIGMVARRRNLGPTFLLSASLLALITGALGCACVGLSGVLGMVLGFGLGLVPSLLRKRPGAGAS